MRGGDSGSGTDPYEKDIVVKCRIVDSFVDERGAEGKALLRVRKGGGEGDDVGIYTLKIRREIHWLFPASAGLGH